MHQSLGQQWKWMDASIPLQTLFSLRKTAEQDVAKLASLSSMSLLSR